MLLSSIPGAYRTRPATSPKAGAWGSPRPVRASRRDRVFGADDPVMVEVLAHHPVLDRGGMRVERLQTGDDGVGIAVEEPRHRL